MNELFTRAEFYDCFGITAFLFIIITSILQLRSKKKLSDWIYYTLLVVGLVGLVVDACMVYFNFLR